MAWNDNPRVRDLEPYAKKHNCKAVIALCFHEDGNYSVSSYGKNRILCNAAKRINGDIFDMVSNCKLEIPEALY